MMKRLLRLLIKAYRMCIAPWLSGSCRFTPTCSSYALDALDVLPAHKALPMILKRLGRCHPLSAHHGYDPVPATMPHDKESE